MSFAIYISVCRPRIFHQSKIPTSKIDQSENCGHEMSTLVDLSRCWPDIGGGGVGDRPRITCLRSTRIPWCFSLSLDGFPLPYPWRSRPRSVVLFFNSTDIFPKLLAENTMDIRSRPICRSIDRTRRGPKITVNLLGYSSLLQSTAADKRALGRIQYMDIASSTYEVYSMDACMCRTCAASFVFSHAAP